MDEYQLYGEKRGSSYIEYAYDVTGIRGMRYNGVNYIFVKNLFGDVVEIWNSSGTMVGKYSYDAYGNTRIVTDTIGIAAVNPFRYRGYYQDSETGLYYLQSRYYDPSLLGFISSDDPAVIFINASMVNATDYYAYCLNDPVNFTDSTGMSIWNDIGNWFKGNWQIALMITGSVLEIVGGIAFIATGAGGPWGMTLIGMGVGSIISGVMNQDNGGSFLSGWVGGQIGGLGTGLIPGFGAVFGGFLSSAATDWIDKGFDKIDWGKAGWNAVLGLVFDFAPQSLIQGMGNAIYKNTTLQLLLSYRGALVGVINGFVNKYY